MGLFGRVKQKIEMGMKRKLIENLLRQRLAKYGGVNPLTGEKVFLSEFEIENYVNNLSDAELFGMPEGTIVTILHQYWAAKLQLNLPDSVIFDHIQESRVTVGVPFPRGELPTDLDLEKYVIFRIRLEEPELWTEDNISDEIIREIVQNASEFYIKNFSKP